jgi:hypothetical protein
MTAEELRKVLSKLVRDHGLEYYVKREEGNLMTVRFLVEEKNATDS